MKREKKQKEVLGKRDNVGRNKGSEVKSMLGMFKISKEANIARG